MVPSRLRNFLRFGLKSMFVLILGMAIGYSLNEWSKLSMRQTMRAWDLLGLDLSEEPQATFSQLNTRYRGGMHINAVRQNSPAAHEGILPGDIIVGVHKWETATEQDTSLVCGGRGDTGLIETWPRPVTVPDSVRFDCRFVTLTTSPSVPASSALPRMVR